MLRQMREQEQHDAVTKQATGSKSDYDAVAEISLTVIEQNTFYRQSSIKSIIMNREYRTQYSPIQTLCAKGCIYSLDWTTGLDYWTGLLDS